MADATFDDLLKDDAGDNPPTESGSTVPSSVVKGWPVADDTKKANELADQDKFLRKYGITGTLDQRFKDVLDAQEKQHQEELRLTLENKQQREQSLAAIKKLQQPNLPTLKNIPSAPPASAYEFQNPFLAFQNPGVFLALMASFATRTPLTAAFNSAAAAMKGFHEGDKEAIDKNVEHWKDSVEQAIKQNKVETDRYVELWNRYHDNYEKLLAEMQAHAAGYKDDMMLAQLRYAGPKETWELIEHRIQAGEQLELSFAHVDEAKAKAEESHTKAQLMAASGMTPEQVDFDVKQMLEGATLTEVEPNIGRGVQGDAKRTMINAEFTRQARELGLTAQDIIDRRNNRAASKAEATAGGRTVGTLGANLAMINANLEKALPMAQQASAQVPRGRIRIINATTQAAAAAISDPKVKALAIANLQVAELWARAMNPRGVMRESDRLYALNLLNTSDSDATYQMTLKMLQDFVHREQAANKEVRSEFTGKDRDSGSAPATGPTAGTPKAEAPPAAAAPTSDVSKMSNEEILKGLGLPAAPASATPGSTPGAPASPGLETFGP